MTSPKEKYVVDKNGEQVGVLLDIEEYRRILADLEELESVRAYEAAKASKSEAIPVERAVKEIERTRQ
ncbi:MAG: hypothetical protein FJY66_04135 [Calditrichaeota bacterium]|nr:hypothetical protein [Calditrichota bacterium]